MSTRKQQAGFSQQDDIFLLREVLGIDPFTEEKRWSAVATKVNTAVDRPTFIVDARRVRERTALLLDHFQREDTAAIGRSGTEEEYIEKYQLLDEIRDLQREAERQKENKKDKTVRDEAKAKEIRKRALETLSEKKTGGEEAQIPTKKKTTVLQYLKEKCSNELEIRTQEIELRKQEINLQRQRFELEKQERLQRLQND